VYTGWDEWFLSCPDSAGSLYVTEKGEGEPLVVLHGGPGGDHRYLIAAVAPLTQHFRVVLYDRRGCLRSPVPLDRVTFQANVADLRALQEQLGAEKIHLFAHSAGAELAAAYVQAFSDLVGRVVLVGPPPLRSGGDEEERELLQQQHQARVAFEKEKWRQLLEQLGYDESDLGKLPDRERSHFYRMRDATLFLRYPERWRDNPVYFYSHEVSMAVGNSMPKEYDFVDALKKHHGNVTVIVGDHDVVDLGGRLARFYYENSPIRLVVLEDAGHNVWIDQPERFLELVREALLG
jgi:Predicted hydrolases or acyltransferases (alpha/beta hydrolase superfamily)